MTAIIADSKTLNDREAAGRFVPLRASPSTPDPEGDPKRLLLARRAWSDLDDLVRPQARQIEENIRMVAGQQRAVFHWALNRWLDVTEWMSAEERTWRQLPVINRLLPWYIITHARATENQPIVTFVPGPDRADAELAEVLDIACKAVWFEAGMEDAHDQLMGWVVAAGRGHLFSRVNPHKGQLRPWVGEAMVPVIDPYDRPLPGPDGQPMSQLVPEGVPFDAQGNPLAAWRATGPGSGELVVQGEPHRTPVGSIEVDVLSPLQVRGSWGPMPWHKKRRHQIRTYLTPEDFYDTYGVELPPDTRGGGAADVGELERLLYGSGFYGAATTGGMDQTHSLAHTDGYIEVTQTWDAPCRRPGMEQTEDSPGGRYLVTTRNTVVYDGPRPFAAPHTSPLSTFEFIRLPGRPGGTTNLEALTPLQRSYNDDHGRLKEHINLSTFPILLTDSAAGIQGKVTNRPGQSYAVTMRPGVVPMQFVPPPRLGDEVFRRMTAMREEFHDLGFMAGANDPGHAGESGEKLKEARFNTDRFLGPTMRRAAGEYGRMFETWRAIFPVIWDLDTTIAYAGEDNVARTITVYPELFKLGQVNVRADVESMLPEGRGEKQEKVFAMYEAGLLGLPGSPQALQKFWELAHMPHLSRAAKPGGIHRTTAEQENGRLLQGEPAETIPVYEWYDHQTHLAVHEHFMASPEFEKLRVQNPAAADAFVLHRQAHLFAATQQALQAAAQQAMVQDTLNPGGGPGGGGGGPKGGRDAAPSVRPSPPNPPSGPIPGGEMPTAAGAS
jgi:hypothetical protein